MAQSRDPMFQHPASANVPDWLYSAACRGMDVAIFYRPDNDRGTSARLRDLRAKAICADCTVQRPCLQWALTTAEPYGIGGAA